MKNGFGISMPPKVAIAILICIAVVVLVAYGRGDIVIHIFDQLLGVACAGFAGLMYAQYQNSREELGEEPDFLKFRGSLKREDAEREE